MELHNIKPAKGAVKASKRIARGQGSGRGGTSTKGHKGAKSRAGHNEKRHFEGGQMPMQRRLPKRGFTNIHRVEYVPLNLARLEQLAIKYNLTIINLEILADHSVIKRSDRVKVLAQGNLSRPLEVHVHAISAKAQSQIEAQGGSVHLL